MTSRFQENGMPSLRPARKVCTMVTLLAALLATTPVAAQMQPRITQAPVTQAQVTPPSVPGVTPPVEPRSAPGLQTPLPDAFNGAQEYAESVFFDLWDSVRRVLSAATGYLSPPSVTDVARYHGTGEDPYDFIRMMDAAGYKLKDVNTSIALIPSVSFTFATARELSDADREWLAAQLERHGRRRTGLVAAAERSIVQSLLDAQELGGYEIETVEVSLFPWPTVHFQISPVDAPLGADAAKLMRAIEKLGESVKNTHQPPPAEVPKVDTVPTPAAAPRSGVQRQPG